MLIFMLTDRSGLFVTRKFRRHLAWYYLGEQRINISNFDRASPVHSANLSFEIDSPRPALRGIKNETTVISRPVSSRTVEKDCFTNFLMHVAGACGQE